MNEWLQQPENVEVFHRICRSSVAELAPEEMPLFEEVFERYVALSAEQSVAIGAGEDDPFGFSGEAELFTLVIIPTAALLLGALLARRGSGRVSEIKDAMSAEEMRQTMEDRMRAKSTSRTLRSRRARPTVDVVMEQIEKER